MNINLQKSFDWWKIMKITFSQLLIALALTSISLAHSGFAQGVLSRQVEISASKMDFSSFLKKLEKTAGVKFIYFQNDVDNSKKVDIDVHQERLKDLLTSVLKPYNLNYDVINDHIVLTKSLEESPVPVLEDKKQVNGPIAEVSVTGIVTDATGQGLPGVTVSLKGTSTATRTDTKGNYMLNIPDYSGMLEFTYVGYVTRDVSINGQKTIDVQLQDENKNLKEVIVVGYGTQRKVNVTGSVATATAADIENRPLTSGSQVLAGLVTGVQVQQGSALPGGDAANITIRGIGTFGAGSAPLILQDGLAVSSMDDIEPDNIKSVSVLKDAASAAIYGNRAANGVILIETKRGQVGKLQIGYNSYAGWQKVDATPDFVNAPTYASLTGQSADIVAKYQSGSDPDNYPNVYHLRDLLKSGNGFQTNQNVSFTGGDVKNSYLFSTGYRDENGITAKTNAKEYNFLLNFDSKLKENLALKISMSGFSKTNTQPVQSGGGGISSIIGYAIREPNTYAGLKSNGDYGHQDSYSPEGWLNSPSFYDFAGKDFLGGATLTWTIIKGLTLSGQAGYRYYNNETSTFVPSVQFDANTFIGPNNLNQGDADGYSVTLNSLLKYTKTIGKHNFSILAGYEQDSFLDEGFAASRDNFPNNLLYQLNAGATTNQQNNGSAVQYALRSFFGRVNYDFAGKYLLEISARDDGSSRFAPQNRFAFFPSVSVGWRISEESFIKDNFKWIDELKLRASTGKLGNQNLTNSNGTQNYYPYQNAISLGQSYNFGGVIAPGASLNTLSNTNIKWETTTTSDIGLDFDLFGGKIDGSVEVYNKITSGILYVVPVAGTLGLTPPFSNAGAMKNDGIEANVKFNQAIGKFNFSIAPNFSYNNSRITKITGNLQSNIAANLFVGQPLNPIYGYVADGIFTNAADVANYPTQPIAGKPGVIRFKDLNGDGKVDATNDRTIIGNTHPKFSYGMTVNAAYGGFDLSVLFQGLGGYQELLNYYANFAYYNGGNIQQWQVDNAWTPANPNPNAKYPQITNLSQGSENVQASSFFVKNATFLRMKNAQIGYSFSNSVLQKIHIAKLRVFVGGQNLFSWNHFYPGFDPEQNQAYNDSPYYYPLTSIYTFGVNLKF